MNKVEKIKSEIEKRKNQFVSQAEAFHKIGKEDKESYYAALASNMNSLSCFIDALETEEADLKKEIADIYEANYGEYLTYEEFADIAKHFFELGLKTKGE